MQVSSSHSADSERAELEVVLAAMGRKPRIASFLRYIAERYFEGRTDEITEFNIATEVFGRSKASFDPTIDSIARVEAHRLRKMLQEYYELEGRNHSLQISLPNRSYIPEFISRTFSGHAIATSQTPADEKNPENPPTAQEVQSETKIEVAETPAEKLRSIQNRTLVYAFAAIAILLLVSFGAVRFFSQNRSAFSNGTISAPWPSGNLSQTPANPIQVPIRLLAGYDGNPKEDSAGKFWISDRYFQGGAAFQRQNAPVARTSDQMLFEHWRTGDFTYDFPLAPGPYELHLFFVAPQTDDPNPRTFHVLVNYRSLLHGFDIASDALGSNVANERVFRDVYPDSDGHLRLGFAVERTSPMLNAIEILPGLPHRQLPIRLVMQRGAITDHTGNFWHPDNYFLGGTASDFPRQVGGTPDSSLYAQERYGHFTYAIPVDTRDRYTVVLHFAELYWGPKTSGYGGAESRVFRVLCNGLLLLDNFDIFKEAGSLHAVTKTFNHLRPSTEGKLDLTFEPIINGATISAIEVIDESE